MIDYTAKIEMEVGVVKLNLKQALSMLPEKKKKKNGNEMFLFSLLTHIDIKIESKG